jgi:importin subunit alpha-2
MASGSDDQTQVVVDSGVLTRLEHLTHSPKDSIKREVFWMVSNILSGTCQQIQSVIDCGLIPLAVKYLSEGSPPIQKDCCWCLSNLLTSESTDQVRYGATLENLCALCSFLVKSLEDEKVVVRVLQALVSVSKADMEELVIKALDGIGGFERFGHFKAHSNDDIKIWYQVLCYYICEPAEDSQNDFISD